MEKGQCERYQAMRRSVLKANKRPGLRRAFLVEYFRSKRCLEISALFGCHLFRFAFLTHQFQFALGGFDLRRHFLLYTRCRFFQFR